MSRKHQLREQRAGTVINLTSKKQESELGRALVSVTDRIVKKYNLELHHERQWKLVDVVRRLRKHFPGVRFHYYFDSSAMRPDGGILSITDRQGRLYPILIVEVKNQGTNDLRKAEGKPKQSKGNAIERLGKNVIGFRTAMLSEGIVPFVCFGYGCDFEKTSSILDRIVTVAMFGPLNRVQVVNVGGHGRFNRGSFFFRERPWSKDDMVRITHEVADRSIHYYFAKYGSSFFKKAKN